MENININNNIPENEIEIFKSDVELYISIICDENNIDDLEKSTQNRWNFVLSELYYKLFYKTDRLKHNPNINNEYNAEYIYYNILPIYINLCNKYSKEVSINGFSKFTGIEYQNFLNWAQESSGFRFGIYKKLMQENEQSNSDLLSSGKNPIGIAMRLNHVHGWNAPNIKNEPKSNQTAAALPTFESPKLCENGTQFIETRAT